MITNSESSEEKKISISRYEHSTQHRNLRFDIENTDWVWGVTHHPPPPPPSHIPEDRASLRPRALPASAAESVMDSVLFKFGIEKLG